MRHAGDQPARGSQTQHRTLGKGNLKSGKNKNFLAKKMILSQIGSKALYRFLNQTTNLGARVQISYFLIFYCLRLNNFFLFFFEIFKFLAVYILSDLKYSRISHDKFVKFHHVKVDLECKTGSVYHSSYFEFIRNIFFYFHKSCCDQNTMFYVYQSIERKLFHVRITHETDFVPIPLKI